MGVTPLIRIRAAPARRAEPSRCLDRHEQVACLYGLIAALLDRVEHEDEELSDEPVLSTPDAVRGIPRPPQASRPTSTRSMSN
ncbi:hypothetical protein [Streptomyces violaceusniger]|uniref:Uncharacterized protein n=1 Tax=Streptomyces violaceusniger (strain Tu 4113) TaxID=653045 RepID=G2NUY5_STRV4|nr:hypothetical protein [Streptomyces violaceusniger]AEM85174.1 hypothetical protein Strvi_5662 [Streptomyces violaceusniger Tu 4113]